LGIGLVEWAAARADTWVCPYEGLGASARRRANGGSCTRRGALTPGPSPIGRGGNFGFGVGCGRLGMVCGMDCRPFGRLRAT